MSRLIVAIDLVGEAADTLTRACARHGALVDAASNDNPFVTAIRRRFVTSSMTPNDMLVTLGKMK